MRYLLSSFVLLAVGLLAIPARAEGDDKKEVKKADDGPRVEWREKVIKEFDKDGDGKLNDEEREKAREKMRELRGRLGLGLGPGGPGGPRGPEGRRGPDGKGPAGPPKLPKPEELFAKFDQDKDEKLNKEEFKELAEWVHQHLPPPPPPGPPGGRFEGRFEGHIEGRFIGGGPGGPGPRFRGPDGPPPPDGDGPREFRRGGFGGPPPFDGPGPRERRFDRRGPHGPPGPPGDRDDDDDEDDDDEKGDKDGKDKAKDKAEDGVESA